MKFIINIAEERDPTETLELEFWVDRRMCQARAISRQGVVTADKQMPMDAVISTLLASVKNKETAP